MNRQRYAARRNKWLPAASLVLATTLAACSAPASDSALGETSRPVRVVLAGEPNTLNTIIRSSGPVRYVSRTMVEALVAQDKTGRPTLDGLVTGIKPKAGTSGAYTLQIRSGVKFQDGAPLTAEDIAFSIEQTLTQSTNKSYWSDLKTAKVAGELTVDVTATGNLTADEVLGRLTGVDTLPKAYYERVGAEQFGKSPVGTGPYKFSAWQPGLKITADRFDDYWGGKPGPSGVEFSFSADGATRKAQVESGAADITSAVSSQLLKSTNDNVQVMHTPSHTSLMWQFTSEGLTADVRIRKAISMTIDPKPTIDQFLAGQGSDAFWVIPPEFTGLDVKRPHDIEAAKRLVTEVKAERGSLPPLELTYWSGRFPADTEIGSATAAQIEAIGLDVKEVPLPDPQFLPKMVGGELKGLHMTAYGMEFPTPDRALQSYTLATSLQGYCKFLAIDEVYAKAKAAATLEERTASYAQIERTDLQEKVCNVPLVKLSENYLVAKKVTGFVPQFDGTLKVADLKMG